MPATPWEWENPVRERHLTGRTRPRVVTRWFRKPSIIMQVEEELVHVHMFDETKRTVRKIWRDAGIFDLTIKEYLVGTLPLTRSE